MTKPVYDIDGRDFDTLEGFYDHIGERLLGGTRWGRNLDAFNDVLRGGFGTPAGGFVLRWRNSDRSRTMLGFPATVAYLEHKLQRCSTGLWVGSGADVDTQSIELCPSR